MNDIFMKAVKHAVQRTGTTLTYFKGPLKFPCLLLSIASIPTQIIMELMLSK